MQKNTTVTINYPTGEVQEFYATGKLETEILSGAMFSVSTIHPDYLSPEDHNVTKMYSGNPMVALGNMVQMMNNAIRLDPEEDDRDVIIDVLSHCVGLLTNELSSFGSGLDTDDIPVTEKKSLGKITPAPVPPVTQDEINPEGLSCPVINEHCESYSYVKNEDGEIISEFCGHPDNGSIFESNCTDKLCPLTNTPISSESDDIGYNLAE